MKRLIPLIALSMFALTVTAMAQPPTPPIVVTNLEVVVTNPPAAVNLPPAFEQVANLIGPKFKDILTQVTIWIGSLSLIIAPFGVRLGNWLRDRLNKIAEGKAAGTDAWLARLFDNPIYKFLSTLLRFINVDLPTTAELERAIQLEKEAIAASKTVTPAKP